MPEVYRNALDASATPATPVAPAASFPGAGSSHSGQRDQHMDTRQSYQSDQKPQIFVPSTDDPEYATAEEAEAAFMKLLKRCGVQPDWTWEQAVRASARDPQFRAIRDPKDRKIGRAHV